MAPEPAPTPAEGASSSAAEPATAAPSRTTKAWTFTRKGEPSEVLQLTREHPVPTFPPRRPMAKEVERLLGEQWVLIRVAYAGLNHGTSFAIRVLPPLFRHSPAVPELDFMGFVEAVWEGEQDPKKNEDQGQAQEQQQHRLAKGDPVCGFIPASFSWATGQGSLQGYIAIPARFAVRAPSSSPPSPGGTTTKPGLREAAGLMVAACTAWHLVENASLKPGQRVLVNAASGGIGTYALQLARRAVGPEGFVVAVCSGRNAELVKSLGADEAINYLDHITPSASDQRPAAVVSVTPLHQELHERYGAKGKPFDAALDCIGIQDLYVHSASFLAPEAVYSAVGVKIDSWTPWLMLCCTVTLQLNAWWPRSRVLGGTGRTWRCVSMFHAPPELMGRLAGMLAAGEVRTVVDSEWAFDDAPAALALLESRRARGKIIIKVDENI